MEQFWLALLSLAGIFLSLYLWKKKSKKGKLVCVIGKDCRNVIESKYGKMFGIDNTILGLTYYIFIFVINVAAIIYAPLLAWSLFHPIVLVVSAIALLTSAYLTLLQIFVIKDFCEYCLASALINLIIFLVILI